MAAMPSGFKEIINKEGHVYLPKSAVEANFVQHPNIKAKLKGTDANEAVAARETYLAFLALHGAVNAPSAKAKSQVVCTWCGKHTTVDDTRLAR
ncbi:hypothetical protein T492DRAFT_884202 [Pavlovales sp. CCMP2436]|nr:hypothetical protein T492DRAFT_884202 [Pavlovales sp. CCMP2436]